MNVKRLKENKMSQRFFSNVITIVSINLSLNINNKIFFFFSFFDFMIFYFVIKLNNLKKRINKIDFVLFIKKKELIFCKYNKLIKNFK